MFCSVCGTEIDRAYLCPKCDSEFCLTHLPEEAHRCGAPPPPLPNHSFGIPSLMFSWVALSIAGYAVYNLSFSAPGGPFHVPGWENFTIIFFIFGPALVLHESMHIVAGRRFGYPAGFEIWQFGIILMLVVAMVGFLFAAPGATVINTDKQHPLSTTETGIIAFSGPLTNLILACLGMSVVGVGVMFGNVFLAEIGLYSTGINLFLAGFNLLPIGGLDGAKVFRWNRRLWAVVFFPAFLIGLTIMFTVF